MSDTIILTQEIKNLTTAIKNLRHDLSEFNQDPIPAKKFVPPSGERLTPAQLSPKIGCSLQTVYSRAAPNAAKPFPFTVSRCGRLLRFNADDVQRAMDAGLI